nr:histone deacetylase complex subunit SAP30 [Pogona vitticeps]
MRIESERTFYPLPPGSTLGERKISPPRSLPSKRLQAPRRLATKMACLCALRKKSRKASASARFSAASAGLPGAAGPGAGQLCCLREEGERCSRAAGNASFSKRIQKSISQKKVKIELDKSARHLYICDFHKNLIQSVRNRRKRKGSDDDGDSPVQDIDTPEVDLFQLQVNTLRRYKRHFKLQTRPGLNKAQLVEIIGCHFRTIPVNEKDTLTYFIYSVKNDKNKSDLKMDSSVH